MIVCDTGPLVAAAFRSDPDYHACTELFTSLFLANRPILIPTPILGEVGYLLGRLAGAKTEAGFLRSLASGVFTPIAPENEDYQRAAELVEQYADFPLGTCDATVIAVAERLGITEVATLDKRHFSVVRPRHTAALTLLP
ncbi:type II toxin-antitoxin system VapC family toxin [Nocardia brasiliensis]